MHATADVTEAPAHSRPPPRALPRAPPRVAPQHWAYAGRAGRHPAHAARCMLARTSVRIPAAGSPHVVPTHVRLLCTPRDHAETCSAHAAPCGAWRVHCLVPRRSCCHCSDSLRELGLARTRCAPGTGACWHCSQLLRQLRSPSRCCRRRRSAQLTRRRARRTTTPPRTPLQSGASTRMWGVTSCRRRVRRSSAAHSKHGALLANCVECSFRESWTRQSGTCAARCRRRAWGLHPRMRTLLLP
jgi:hypothetical protein